MALNIYLPKVDGIELTDVTVGEDVVEFTTTTITVGGEAIECYVFSWDSAAASFDAAVATVSFEVTNFDYYFFSEETSANITLDVVRYATIVAEGFDCGSEEANLVYEMMNYKEAVATILNAEYARNEATEAFYALHVDCACGVDINISEEEVADTSALADKGITGVTFDISEVGVISMYLASENAALEVAVTYFDGLQIQNVEVEYNEDAAAYVAKNIPAAYIDNIMTITVDGATGTYCLAAYINSELVPAEAKVVATALYEYAMAAEAYKHVIKTEAAQ